ncbi:MAG: hypothetical protein C0404_08520 [Verrucomicrobia bacterium]|nr:hypothetical protein [Verrucomicrobiota bacterium]
MTSNHKAGHTVIELVAVVGIVAIFLAIAIAPKFSPQSERAQVAAFDLETSLRYAQKLAFSRERNVRVTFSVVSNAYWVDLSDTNAPGGYKSARNPVTQQDWNTVFSDMYAGVRLSSVSLAGGVLVFNRTNGVPCANSGTPIAATATVVFVSGPTIMITPDTGYVSKNP